MTAPTKRITPKIEITIAITLSIPLFFIRLQIRYRIKTISIEKLIGIDSVLPKYRIKEAKTLTGSISKTEKFLLERSETSVLQAYNIEICLNSFLLLVLSSFLNTVRILMY